MNFDSFSVNKNIGSFIEKRGCIKYSVGFIYQIIRSIYLGGLGVVGKGSWKDRLVGISQLNDFQCINKNLETSFQHKIFELNDLSNWMYANYGANLILAIHISEYVVRKLPKHQGIGL